MTAFDNLYNACDGDNIWDEVPDVDELMRLASAIIKTLQLELAKTVVKNNLRHGPCLACNQVGASHCSDPVNCGAMPPNVHCPVCWHTVPLYFSEESKHYESSCANCYAALTLRVIMHEGEV